MANKPTFFPGYGIRASEPIFEICRCLGITDLSAKITRSRNRMNVIKAVLEGLRNQKRPGTASLPGIGHPSKLQDTSIANESMLFCYLDTIARGRGIKLADVRKVYYNGANVRVPPSSFL